MGNRITNCKNYSLDEYLDRSLKMSNGLTSVFISVLALSASSLAQTHSEINFAIWLAAHDQSIVGMGTVGFDVSELPWSAENFEAEKQFVLRVIESAQSQALWSKLSYTPHTEWVLAALEKFGALIADLTVDFIRPNWAWCELDNNSPTPTKCPTHDIYLHIAGCVICND